MKEKTVTQLKNLALKKFSRYIRLRDCLESMNSKYEGRCITCGTVYEISDLQAGHFVPGRTNAILFDPRNCHAQCAPCNVFLHGNLIEYYPKMLLIYGQEVIDELRANKKIVKPFRKSELLDLIDIFDERIKELEGV